MGEVYRAKDTRLERTVAIKILPAQVSADPLRKQRFEWEAKTISNLNHPHICVLHDIGHQDGIDYLVMECLEGETLAKRLEKGPLPLEQVHCCCCLGGCTRGLPPARELTPAFTHCFGGCAAGHTPAPLAQNFARRKNSGACSCGCARQNPALVAAVGFAVSRAPCRDRRSGRALLVAGRPVHRFLRGWQVEDGSDLWRSRGDALRRAFRRGRQLEQRWKHNFCSFVE